MCSVQSRFYVTLDDKSKDEIRFILRQTSNLWSLIVAHVGDVVLEIARSSKDTPRVTEQIESMVTLAYRILIHEEDHGFSFKVDDYWKKRIAYIRKLPMNVMENRLQDLVQAYIYVHNKYVNGVEYPYVPVQKAFGSTQTARFCAPSCSFTEDTVSLKLLSSTVKLTAVGVGKVPKGNYAVTLTKKRPGRVRDNTCMNDTKRSSYYISLSNE